MPPEGQQNPSPKIKWNEVTWYSRLGAVILFIGVVPALSFYIGTKFQQKKDETIINQLSETIFNNKKLAEEEQLEVLKKTISSSITQSTPQTTGTYTPIPIDLHPVPSEYGGFKEYVSPNGQYIAHSYSDEQGDSGIYISDKQGTALTQTYCGFFNEWGSDSSKIKVFVPSECSAVIKSDVYFFLHIDGSVELTSGN